MPETANNIFRVVKEFMFILLLTKKLYIKSNVACSLFMALLYQGKAAHSRSEFSAFFCSDKQQIGRLIWAQALLF